MDTETVLVVASLASVRVGYFGVAAARWLISAVRLLSWLRRRKGPVPCSWPSSVSPSGVADGTDDDDDWQNERQPLLLH